VHRRGRICIMWWNLRQFNIKQLFIHNQIKFDHH